MERQGGDPGTHSEEMRRRRGFSYNESKGLLFSWRMDGYVLIDLEAINHGY